MKGKVANWQCNNVLWITEGIYYINAKSDPGFYMFVSILSLMT